MGIQLSVCIATLNRAKFIGATLETIVSQATDEVEIIVVDGASTDNTQEVVLGIQKRFPRLDYTRLEAKGGIDRDYSIAVARARGEYCWLFADDDLLKPGAVRAVLNAIGRGHALVVVNAEVRTFDLTRLVEPQRLPLTASREYGPAEFESFFVENATYLSFLGCVVIRRRLWQQREQAPYLGTEFVHVGVIFQQLPETSMLVLGEPWIIIRGGNAQWRPRYFEIWMFKWPALIWSFRAFSDEAKRQVCPREPWRMARMLLVLRARGAYSAAEYHRWLAPRLRGRARWTARLIAALPGQLVNLLVLAYFLIRHRDRQYSIFELRDSPFYYRHKFRRKRGGG